MIIATKELIGPVVAVCLWGTSHQDQTAVVINDNQNAWCWINSRGSRRNTIAQYLIFVLTRAETSNDLEIFAAYVNTNRNSIADQGTWVLTGLTSGAETADRAEEYYAWAAQTLPGYLVENSTNYVEGLLPQAGNQDSPGLGWEPKRPPALVRRATGRNPNTETAGPLISHDGRVLRPPQRNHESVRGARAARVRVPGRIGDRRTRARFSPKGSRADRRRACGFRGRSCRAAYTRGKTQAHPSGRRSPVCEVLARQHSEEGSNRSVSLDGGRNS